jgi:hypothetical protein
VGEYALLASLVTSSVKPKDLAAPPIPGGVSIPNPVLFEINFCSC